MDQGFAGEDGASLIAQLVFQRIRLQRRRPGFNPWVGKVPWSKGNSYPLQYSGLENSMDYIYIHGVAKSWTRLSDFRFQEMAGSRKVLNIELG